MSPALVKAVMKAIKSNNIAIIRAMAQRARMSTGKLVSQAKKISRKTKKKKPMSKREKTTRARLGQST